MGRFYCGRLLDCIGEIQDLCRKSSVDSQGLRYMKENSESFGGNISTQKRRSYFQHLNDNVEIPCGFFKKFPVSNSGQCYTSCSEFSSFPLFLFFVLALVYRCCFFLLFVYIADRMAMESCKGVVVVSAIFNDHDKIRQPKNLGSKTLENVCFFMIVDETTLQGLRHHQLISGKSFQYSVGVWRILKVSSTYLYENPAMNGVIPKYLAHRLFPNSKFSIWIDAKLQLMVDPLLLIHALVVSKKVDMAISRHPYFMHTMEEAMATARWRKWWDIDGLRIQMETYCENGLKPWTPNKLTYPSGTRSLLSLCSP